MRREYFRRVVALLFFFHVLSGPPVQDACFIGAFSFQPFEKGAGWEFRTDFCSEQTPDLLVSNIPRTH